MHTLLPEGTHFNNFVFSVESKLFPKVPKVLSSTFLPHSVPNFSPAKPVTHSLSAMLPPASSCLSPGLACSCLCQSPCYISLSLHANACLCQHLGQIQHVGGLLHALVPLVHGLVGVRLWAQLSFLNLSCNQHF